MTAPVKILIVDDDPDLLEMVSLILSQKQFEVTPLNEWQKTYDAIRTKHPDIILMDIYLGGMDGRQLCRELKLDPEFSAIPILLYSAGHITPQSIRESMASHFIVKPFDMNFLLEAIRSHIPTAGNQ